MKSALKFVLLVLFLLGLCLDAFRGAEDSFVVLHFRLPSVVAALLGGASLAVSGLAMQSVFRNPLAGPFVLGVSSGASLGVALVSIAGISFGTAFGAFGVLPAAALGAFAVICAVFSCSRFIKNSAGLLIVGLMIGYICDAIVSFLMFMSEGESLRGFLAWGMGSFSRLTFEEIPLFAGAICTGILPLLFSIRYLNLAPLGDAFAMEHGVNVKVCRRVTLLAASFLAAVVTAFCGPIAFLGLAVPHLAYGLFRSTNHRVLFPAAMLIGAVISLAASLFSQLPLQSFMSIVGAPVVLWVLLSSGSARHE